MATNVSIEGAVDAALEAEEQRLVQEEKKARAEVQRLYDRLWVQLDEKVPPAQLQQVVEELSLKASEMMEAAAKLCQYYKDRGDTAKEAKWVKDTQAKEAALNRIMERYRQAEEAAHNGGNGPGAKKWGRDTPRKARN